MAKIDYPAILEEAWRQHLAPREPDAPTLVSLFVGCGGSSLGYSMAGYRELLAVEWDDNAVETFKLNFLDVPVYHGDIHKLTVVQCLEMTDLQPGELDLLDGSPPCQGFSTAGKRQMTDKRNQLYMEFIRLLRGLQSKVFVMENVSGLVKGKMKLIFADIMRELKASGYEVRCKLLNAMYFHVPQSRQRLIWIGVRKDLKEDASFPKASSKPICALCAIENIQDMIVNPSGPRKFSLASRHLRHHCSSPTLTSNSEVPGSVAPFDDKGIRIGAERAAVIGSYPKAFQFSGNWQDKLNRIGNSVPPLFMRAIAQHIQDNILSKAVMPECLSQMGLELRRAE